MDRSVAETELLRICHVSRTIDELMTALGGFLGSVSGCEAIGVRLRRDGDFPYYTTRGFPEAFVRAERYLCAYSADGRRKEDEDGNPVLACMCGNIICGRFDPSRDFFTPHGSFWTNSTTRLLASTTEADRQARTRNRCNGEGYESVALLPLRSSGSTFGLVQFNDRRPDRFDAETIASYERLVDYVAIALAKFEAEEALTRSEERYRIVADQTHDWEFWVDPAGQVVYMSPSCERITGYPVEAFVSDPTLRRRVVAQEDQAAWDQHRRECHVEAVPGIAVFRVVRPDGGTRWVEHVCRPIFAAGGRFMGIRGSNRDVTDRRAAEEARDAALREQQQLVVQLQDALAHVKTLRGFIPICAACKKIRNDAGYWQAVEVYVRDHTEAEFSHGLCPACFEQLYPGMQENEER
jgi:PAS domain S-box-containing protein